MKLILHYMKRLYAYSGAALTINLLGMVFSSLLESVGILLLIPMIGMSGILSVQQATRYDFRWLKELQEMPQTLALTLILSLYVMIVFGQNLIQRKIMIRNVEIQQIFSRKLRFEIYSTLLASKWSFFLKKRKSDLINLLTIELARVISGINLFLQLVTSSLFTLIQIVFAFWLSPVMTLFVLGCGTLLALFSRHYIHQAKLLGNQTSVLSQSYLAGITDQLNGIKDIKSNNLEDSRLGWLQSLTKGMMHEQMEYIRLRMNSQLLYKISSALLIAGFVFISFRFFHTNGPQLLLVILIFARLWPRFTSIQSNLEQMAATVPAFKAMITLQQECAAAAEQRETATAGSSPAPLRLKQGLTCDNVYFRYHSGEAAHTLQEVNLFIPANRMTAFVGRSGAGKSTLIDLLMGLMQPESGQILIDGEPLTTANLFAFRRSIGYVAQDPFLYNASIRENLLMIQPGASEDQLWEALAFASSAEFVRALPLGLDTLIGDRGIRLSGGERQRLVLARAIISKPAVLVLDEATSALDTENEKKIQEALERLKGTMTIIVVAHRLSTIRHADQVIVIDQGKVVQRGGFNQLAAERGGVFGHLLDNQKEAIV